MIRQLLKRSAACICMIAIVSTACAQKATIDFGPARAYTKQYVELEKELGKTRFYTSEAVYIKKGDWIVAKAQCEVKPVSIDVYDRVAKKYLVTREDTAFNEDQVYGYRTDLYFQVPRTDSFDILFNYKKEPIGTDGIDYTVAVIEDSWKPKDTSWSFARRLSYLCNHWTTGFSSMPRTKDTASGPDAFLPGFPLSVDDRFFAGMRLMEERTMVYMMESDELPYAKTKLLYDEMSRKLKAVTDKQEIKDLSKGKGDLELGTTHFSLKVPDEKCPFDYSHLESAGNGYTYLPISLFLLGNKTKATVIITIGEAGMTF